MEQTDEFFNSYRRKTRIADGVEPIVVPNIGLLEITHDNPAPPAVLAFPFERQMPLGRDIHLGEEIDIKLKRSGLIVKQTCLLHSGDEELLWGRVGTTC